MKAWQKLGLPFRLDELVCVTCWYAHNCTARQHGKLHFVQVGSRAYIYDNISLIVLHISLIAQHYLTFANTRASTSSALSMPVVTHDECLVLAPLAACGRCSNCYNTYGVGLWQRHGVPGPGPITAASTMHLWRSQTGPC